MGRAGKSLEEVAEAIGLTPKDLGQALNARRRLAQAWERGRLLANVDRLARIGSSYEEAGHGLGLPPGGFEELLAADPEVRDTWRQATVDALQAIGAALYTQAAAGKASAVSRLVDRFSRREQPAEVNFLALSVNETAAAFGVSRQTVHAWATRGGAPRNTDGSFHLPALIRWRVDQAVQEAGPVPADGPAAAERFKAIKASLLELTYKRETGDLLERAAVVAGLANRTRHQAAVLDADVAALAVSLEGKPTRRIRRILADRFTAYRRRMADVPAELKLPPWAEGRLGKLLADLTEPERAA